MADKYFDTQFHVNADVDSGAAEALSPTSKPVVGRVWIKAGTGNGANTIFVGKDNTVSASTGVPLTAGQVIEWRCTDLNQIWVIASADNQAVSAWGEI